MCELPPNGAAAQRWADDVFGCSDSDEEDEGSRLGWSTNQPVANANQPSDEKKAVCPPGGLAHAQPSSANSFVNEMTGQSVWGLLHKSEPKNRHENSAPSSAEQSNKISGSAKHDNHDLCEKWRGPHNDLCEKCTKGGEMLCCDYCNLVYHLHCLTPPQAAPPEGDWACEACRQEWIENCHHSPKAGDQQSGQKCPSEQNSQFLQEQQAKESVYEHSVHCRSITPSLPHTSTQTFAQTQNDVEMTTEEALGQLEVHGETHKLNATSHREYQQTLLSWKLDASVFSSNTLLHRRYIPGKRSYPQGRCGWPSCERTASQASVVLRVQCTICVNRKRLAQKFCSAEHWHAHHRWLMHRDTIARLFLRFVLILGCFSFAGNWHINEQNGR
jgi:hypothetical protein